jgi:dTDP-4-dehydrorhamnose 3,5-epimerase-like enzyme
MVKMSVARRTKTIVLPEIVDDRGRLMFAEDSRHIPFPVKRIFAIYDIPPGRSRGTHAHRTQHQFVIMLAGSCSILIDEGAAGTDEHLDNSAIGLYVPPMVWIELKNFSSGAVCLVLASAHFDETDYIRDYSEFKRLLSAQ